MSESIKAQREQFASKAIEHPDVLEELVNSLESSSRRKRQNAASVLSMVAYMNPEAILPSIDALLDALEKPEAQTRWECLEALAVLVDHDAATCERALLDAENALFDEESGPLHLAAVRYLCKLGSTSDDRARKVCPLIDEAIQCYHGDLEFSDMLNAVALFAEAKLPADVRDRLARRFEFDAEQGKGGMKKRAQHILDILYS